MMHIPFPDQRVIYLGDVQSPIDALEVVHEIVQLTKENAGKPVNIVMSSSCTRAAGATIAAAMDASGLTFNTVSMCDVFDGSLAIFARGEKRLVTKNSIFKVSAPLSAAPVYGDEDYEDDTYTAQAIDQAGHIREEDTMFFDDIAAEIGSDLSAWSNRFDKGLNVVVNADEAMKLKLATGKLNNFNEIFNF